MLLPLTAPAVKKTFRHGLLPPLLPSISPLFSDLPRLLSLSHPSSISTTFPPSLFPCTTPPSPLTPFPRSKRALSPTLLQHIRVVSLPSKQPRVSPSPFLLPPLPPPPSPPAFPKPPPSSPRPTSPSQRATFSHITPPHSHTSSPLTGHPLPLPTLPTLTLPTLNPPAVPPLLEQPLPAPTSSSPSSPSLRNSLSS
jgi:hypothetical protein